MGKIKESVLFTFQVIGGIITFLTVSIAAFWWLAGFYYKSNFNDELMKSVVDKHELQLSKVIKENNVDHKKLFQELTEIKIQLIEVSTVLKATLKTDNGKLTLRKGDNNG